MRFRLTPLNIISAALLVIAVYLIIYRDTSGWRLLGSIPVLLIMFICFAADILFRTYLKNTKRVWIVELVFIIFAILTIMVVKQSKL